ncbi:MAG: hypothetical protein II793_00100, partial [Bacteroidales bacterium]|nr:hypothetical protein [Bacteroidales bacterium]
MTHRAIHTNIALLLTAILLAAVPLKAQNSTTCLKPKGEIAVSVYGPAMASLPFKSDFEWNDNRGYSMGFGADYTHWYNRHFGLTAGFKITYLTHSQTSGIINENFNGTMPMTGLGATSVVMRGTANTVNETQTMTFAEIPVRLSFEAGNAYLNLGAALSVALTDYSDFAYNGTGYAVTELPDMGVSLPVEVPVQLNGRTRNSNFPSELSRTVYGLLSAELGYKFRFDHRNAVSLGIFG